MAKSFRQNRFCWISFALLLATFSWAAETVDAEIVKNFDFFDQMKVAQNLELAQNLEVLED